MILLEWASTLVSFLGTYRIATHHREGWLLCIVGDVGFVIFGLRKHMYGFLLLCAGYSLLNWIGWVKS